MFSTVQCPCSLAAEMRLFSNTRLPRGVLKLFELDFPSAITNYAVMEKETLTPACDEETFQVKRLTPIF